MFQRIWKFISGRILVKLYILRKWVQNILWKVSEIHTRFKFCEIILRKIWILFLYGCRKHVILTRQCHMFKKEFNYCINLLLAAHFSVLVIRIIYPGKLLVANNLFIYKDTKTLIHPFWCQLHSNFRTNIRIYNIINIYTKPLKYLISLAYYFHSENLYFEM